MNFGNVENVLMRGVGGTPTSTGDMERMSSEPQEPGFFSASNSNERMSYNLWQELRAETMKRNLLYELDKANNPMSLGDVSRITGQGADVLATEAQRSIPQYQDRTEKYKEEGPQPMGMVPIDKEVVDVVNPLRSQFTPRQLLGDDALPELSAVAWDQYDRRQAPYWTPGPDEPITRDILAPGIIQGPGAPIEKERTVRETVGFSPNERADATPWQRQMAEAKIHQMGLRPLVGGSGKLSAIQEKYNMLISHGVPEDEAAMLVGGMSNFERQSRQTDANIDLMSSKGRNLDEQTRVSKEMFSTRKNYYNQQARLAEARATDLKDTAPDKKAHLQQQTKTASALERYYQHRMESGDVELAIRESKLMQSLNEADRKQLVAAMKFLKDNKMEISGEQFDQMIDSIGQGLGFRGTISQAPLTDRLWNAISGHSEENVEDPASFELPSQRMAPPAGESQMRSGSVKRSNVPSKDASSVLDEMAKELGDLTKLEGKVVRDAKTGKRYRVQGGKLQEAK